MRRGPKALGCILSCAGLAAVLLLAACSDSDDSGDPDSSTTSTSTTTTLPPGPSLDTNTDDVEAAMRSLLEFHFWAEANPEAALARSDEWLVPGGPRAEDFNAGLQDQIEQGLLPTGHPELLEIRVETAEDDRATVLAWLRSDGYRFDGPAEHAFDSPPFERTLFIFELEREPDGAWRVFDRRIALQG